MANNPNSFYIGIPTTSVQPPENYDGPKYIQIIGLSNSVADVHEYYDYSSVRLFESIGDGVLFSVKVIYNVAVTDILEKLLF